MNRKYAIASLLVDLVFKSRYVVFGKVFGVAIEDTAVEIRSFKAFDRHVTVKGIYIGYEHLDIKYAPKKVLFKHYVMKIYSDKTSFQLF